MSDTEKNPTVDGNQGEGNRTAAARYNAAAERHAMSGASAPAAAKARADLDADRGALAAAEAAGRAPAQPTVGDQLRAVATRLRRKAAELFGDDIHSRPR